MLRRPVSHAATALALLALVGSGLAQDVPYRTPPDRPVDLRQLDLDLTIDLKEQSVSGSATLDVKARVAAQHVELDAVEHEIQRVRLAGGQELRHDYDGERLIVHQPLQAGEEARLVVEYRVRQPKSGLHFYAPSEDAPRVPYQVWSQGEPEHNRHWFPSIDHPSERLATSLTARVKPNLTVISNGTLKGKTTDEETGLVAWRFEQEREHVAYLVTLVVGEFAAAHDEWRGIPLGYYVPPERAADIPRSFSKTKAMLDLFSEKTGVLYPWPKYDQVVVEQFGWGGMENTGATTLNERTLHDERAHLDFSSEGLVAHELAHQWFGDLMTCQDWTHIWLNESFASYLTAVWFEFGHSQDAYADSMIGNMDGGLGAGRDRPIADRHYPNPTSMFDGRAYPKGACVLHMLRRQLGEEIFWKGVRTYVSRHKDTSVETSDLRQTLEDVSGRNLERFFYDWIQRPGHLDLEVTLSHDAKRGLTMVTLTQQQQGEPYYFPAELMFRFGDEVERHTLDVTRKEERFFLPSAAAPDDFRFDPDEKVLLKKLKVNKPRAMWLEQLASSDAFGRIRAARALADDKHPEVEAALIKSLTEDPFWSVQRTAARSLGRFKTEGSQAALVAGLQGHEEAKVRRECASQLGRQGQKPELAEVLGEVLTTGDASYYVEAEAVSAYARVSQDPKAVLLAQLDKTSHNQTIRDSAIRALGDLEDPSIAAALLPYLGRQHEAGVRRTTARALKVARLQGVDEKVLEQVVEGLTDFLRHGGRGERRAALDGLDSLAALASAALPALDACAENDAERNLRGRAEALAAKIRRGEQPSQTFSKLQGELNELREINEELRDRLEKIEASLDGGASKPTQPEPAGGK